MRKIYSIYCHADTDGGIAAAIFGRFIKSSFPGWDVNIFPVQHTPQEGEWRRREIHWPCAILDFTLHPRFLDSRFFDHESADHKTPPCYWVDHHPTGAPYHFLTAENSSVILNKVISKWDVTAISTPGLMRTHREDLKLPDALIKQYEHYIDLAEIIDGALFATAEAAHDFTSTAIKLQTIFNPSHPVADKNTLYQNLAHFIMNNENVEDLFDSDPIYSSLIEYERRLHSKQFRAYTEETKLIGKVAVSNFFESKSFEGLGRFVPYIIFPEAHYALHVLPKGNGVSTITCGINPWNKPKTNEKHLGHYFAKHFGGGGHSFVAGGKFHENEYKNVEKLIEFINS